MKWIIVCLFSNDFHTFWLNENLYRNFPINMLKNLKKFVQYKNVYKDVQVQHNVITQILC